MLQLRCTCDVVALAGLLRRLFVSVCFVSISVLRGSPVLSFVTPLQ